MKKNSFSARVREAVRELGKGGAVVLASDLFDKVGVQTYGEKKTAYNTVADLARAGDLVRVARGAYKFASRSKKPEKRVVMWKFLRVERTVEVDDLVEVAGVSADYAREWIAMLVARRIVRDCGNGKFQLVSDPLEPPRDEEKARRLRELRRKRREAVLAAVRAVHDATCRLCGQMEELVVALSDGNRVVELHDEPDGNDAAGG